MGDGSKIGGSANGSSGTAQETRSLEQDGSAIDAGNVGDDCSEEEAGNLDEGGRIEQAADAFGAEVDSMFSKFTRVCETIAKNSLQGLPELDLCGMLGSPEPQTFEAKAASNSETKPRATGEEPAPCLEIDKFVHRAKRLFAGLDADSDGTLSTDELAAAVQDHRFQGQDAQVVAALYQTREELKNLSDDQWFETGVTEADLGQFSSTLPKQLENWRLAIDSNEWLAADGMFKAVDANGNGFLSQEELTKALQQSDQSTRLPEFYSQMISRLNTIQAESDDEFWIENDGITRKDLQAHAKTICDSKELRLVGVVAAMLSRTSDAQKGGATFELFGGKNPADSITPDAIKQGQTGDCSFLSTLASVAKSNRSLIEHMIQDNKDGTYTVKFPGADKPITVDAPTQAEAGLYNSVGESGIWPLVLEKAYGKFCQDGVSPRFPSLNKGAGNTAIESGGKGADLSAPMELLTGNRSLALTTMFTWHSQMRKELEDAFRSSPPRAVTAGTSCHTASEGKTGTTVDGFPKRHAYSIIGFDPKGPGGGTVTVRNPWGGTEGSTEGTIDITFDQFRKNFTNLAIEQRK